MANIDQIIASAKIRLRLTDTSAPDMALEHYILEGGRSINAIDSFIQRQKLIDVIDGRAELPCDFYRFLAVRITGIEATEDTAWRNCDTILYVNTPYLYSQGCDCSGDVYANFAQTFQIIDGYIHFNSATPAQQIILSYEARNVDENGIPVFPENYVRGLAAYACFQYGLSNPVTQLDSTGYSVNQIQSWQQEWVSQRNYIVGSAVKLDARNRKAELMATVNSMITTKNPYVK
jgi:hypothetical protein